MITKDSALPPAVPGADEHPALALVNTLFSVPGNDAVELLTGPEDTTMWLVERDLVPAGTRLQDYCHGKLTTLRGHLRGLMDSLIDGSSPAEADLAAVNVAIRTAPQTFELVHQPGGGFSRRASHPVTQLVEHAMARVAEDAVELLTGDDSSAVERCEAPSCDRVFLRTHARRHWCCTRCGDRVRAARAYAKKKAAAKA